MCCVLSPLPRHNTFRWRCVALLMCKSICARRFLHNSLTARRLTAPKTQWKNGEKELMMGHYKVSLILHLLCCFCFCFCRRHHSNHAKPIVTHKIKEEDFSPLFFGTIDITQYSYQTIRNGDSISFASFFSPSIMGIKVNFYFARIAHICQNMIYTLLWKMFLSIFSRCEWHTLLGCDCELRIERHTLKREEEVVGGKTDASWSRELCMELCAVKLIVYIWLINNQNWHNFFFSLQ